MIEIRGHAIKPALNTKVILIEIHKVEHEINRLEEAQAGYMRMSGGKRSDKIAARIRISKNKLQVLTDKFREYEQ